MRRYDATKWRLPNEALPQIADNLMRRRVTNRAQTGVRGW